MKLQYLTRSQLLPRQPISAHRLKPQPVKVQQSTPLSERTDQHTPPPYARSEAATLSHTMPPSTPTYEMTNQPTTPETANESEMLTQNTPPPETTNQSAPLSKAANEGATLSHTTPLADATNQRPAPPLITSNEVASGSGLDSGVTTTTINTTTTTTINTTTTTTTITTNTTASAIGGGHHPRKLSRSLRSYLHTAQWSDSSRKKRGAKPTSRAQLKGVELPQHIWHLPSGFFQCVVCEGRGYCLQSLRGVRSHCEGRRHQTEAAKAQAQLLEEAPKLKVTTSGRYHRAFRAHSLTLPLTPEGPRQMTFTLTNVTRNTSLRFVKWHGPYFNGELRFVQPSANSATAPPALEGPEKLIIYPGRSIDLTLQITPQEETTLSFKAHFHLEDLGRKVDACKFAPVVENCPVRISVVGGAEAGGDTDGSGGNETVKRTIGLSEEKKEKLVG
ncbi:hypothetical protein ACOMHN_016446 [Nucella lapillus]